jgi:hypothetical protein
MNADRRRGAGRDADTRSPPRSGAGRRKPFLLRVSPELLEELRSWASSELRSLNGQIEYLLQEAVRRRKRGDRQA